MARIRVKIFSGRRSSVEGKINAYLAGKDTGKVLDTKLVPLNPSIDPSDSNPGVMVMLTIKDKD